MADDVQIAIGAKDNASRVLDSIANRVGTFGTGIASKLHPALILAAAAAGAAAAAFVVLKTAISAMSEASDEVDALSDKARSLGETVGDIQAFQFAMNESGNLDASASLAALTKIQRIVGDIAGGGDDTTFRKLNLDAKALSLKGPIDQFNAIRDALAKIENNSERASLAQKLLGKSASELLPAITASSEEFRKSAQYARDVGATVSEEGVQGIAEMNDALGRVSLMMKGLVLTTLQELAPVIKEIASGIASWGPAVGRFVTDYMKHAKADITYIADEVIKTSRFFGLMNENTKTFSESMEKSQQLAAKLAALPKVALEATPSAEELAAADVKQKAIDNLIASMERQIAVAKMGEDSVRKQEQLALARNDAERDRIMLLQEQLQIEKQIASDAEKKKKDDEAIAKERERVAALSQKKDAKLTGQTQELRATESRFLTRGPANDTAKQLLEEAKAQKELQRLQNRTNAEILAELKRKGPQLSLVGGPL